MEREAPDVLPQAVRLNRFLAMAGVASRRKAEELILSGEVTVNGTVVTDLATRVTLTDRVSLSGRRLRFEEKRVYILLNKPNDYITTAKDERDRKTIFNLIDLKQRVFAVGRLDRKTTGVLLLTNDGPLAHRLMHPSFGVLKTYYVKLSQSLAANDAAKLRRGIRLEDGRTAPARVEPVPGTKGQEVMITMHEGRNRQVRRMLESLGYSVSRLDRVAYAGITHAGLGRGRWRYLTPSEVKSLKEASRAQRPRSAAQDRTSRTISEPDTNDDERNR